MKTKLFVLLVLAGIVLAGCSSTQNTTTDMDSDSVAIMQDTVSPETMEIDTTIMDTAKRDTGTTDSL